MKKVICLILLAFLIRLISLNQSLWLDEAITANAVRRLSAWQLLTQFSLGDFHPPLYYLLMKEWTQFFGYSEIALRLPSVIFSLLTGVVLYLGWGFLPAALFLFNPLVVYYSQEARMYMLSTFFLTLAFLALKKKKTWLYLASLIVSFYTFYGTVFFIVALALYFLLKQERKLFWQTVFGLVGALVFISPLLYRQWQNASLARLVVVNWQSVLGPASLKNLLLIPIKFSVGRISFEPKIVYYILSLGWAAVLWSVAAYGAIKRRAWQMATIIIVSIGLGLLFSFFTPLLQYFRFIYLIPYLSVLVSFGLEKPWQKTIIIAGLFVFSLIYLCLPRFHREDWQALVRFLPRTAQVLGIVSSLEGLKYYRESAKITDIRGSLPRQQDFYVIPYTFPVYGLEHEPLMTKKQFKLVKKWSFRELELERWAK